MTDGDCPAPDDATVILVDSLERAFQHNSPSVHMYMFARARVCVPGRK